jgi:hypothetical protein
MCLFIVATSCLATLRSTVAGLLLGEIERWHAAGGMAAGSSAFRGLDYRSQPRQPPSRTKIVLDIKYKSVHDPLKSRGITHDEVLY